MAAREEINKILKENNAQLLRQKKHLVYKLPNGKQFTMSKTPRTEGSWDAHLADLKRGLGIKSVKRTNGKVKYSKNGKAPSQPIVTKSVPLSDWRAQLKEVKVQIVENLPWYRKIFYTRTWRRWGNYYYIARKKLRLIWAQPQRPL